MSDLTLLGIVLGALLALLVLSSEYQERPRARSNKLDPSIGAYRSPPQDSIQTRRPSQPSRVVPAAPPGLPASPTQPQTLETKPSQMVRDWRRAVEGLIELAFRNLKNAKELLATDSFDAAVKSASTGVENMARALIHCCGGKPEVCGGQEEPLRLLLTRFMEGERKEIGEAIQTVAWIELNKAVLRYVSKSNIAVQLLDRAKAEQIIEASERVLIMFRQVMARHFATELPGLSSDICPKCKSLLTVVSCFNKDTVRYECESCHNKWEESRNRA